MNPVPKKNQKKNSGLPCLSAQSGSILILVVWMMALFSFWVLSSAAAGISALGVARRFQGDLKSYALARSATVHVRKILEDDETPKHDGVSEEIMISKDFYDPQVVGDGNFEIFHEFPNPVTGYPEKKGGIMDEERKLNLNTIETDILESLFEQLLHLKPKDQKALVQGIADWRDEDNDRRESGAEKFEYLVLKKPYECKNGPFESLDELLLVKGMTPQILKKIRPYLTVYGSGKVNINTAMAQVLTALGLSEAGVSGILFYRRGQDGEADTGDETAVVHVKSIASELSIYLSSEDVSLIARLQKDDLLDVRSEAFSFSAVSHLETYAYSTRLDVVMKKDGEILAWQEK